MNGDFIGATRELLALLDGPQANRLLRLDFPRGDAPDGVVFLSNTLNAYEGLSTDFRFTLEVLADNARVPLKDVFGKMVCVSLVREDGSLRYFNGYVTEFRLVKTDGGFAYYSMLLEPWLAFARLRQDCVVFQEQSVIGMTETTFAQYDESDYKTCLFNEYASLSCAIQYNETDANHLHRRWEGAGLYYWYEHRADGHTLWLGDNSEMAEAIDPGADVLAPDQIAFRRYAGSTEADGVYEWQAVREAGAGSVTLSSFDYKQPSPQHLTRESLNLQGAVAGQERFHSSGAYGFSDTEGGDALALLRVQEIDAKRQHYEAKGNVRTVMPGRSFTLDGHFSAVPLPAEPGQPAARSIADREYLILSVAHQATNNYQLGREGTSVYECSFSCMRKSVPWRPGIGFNSKETLITGTQSAIVVGPAGKEIYTDQYGRIKVQFHWDRKGKRDAGSSCWMRVASACAGNERGWMAVPRIGEEVLVDFMGGNPDRPVATGRVFNRDNMPPWELNGQEALTGLRSRELGGGGNAAGGRSNHLILDDTNGQIQAQLRSDHLDSQLALGYVTRIETNAGRTDARGEGWELRTDGHGVVRAAEGMLITTEGRIQGTAHAKDMGETVERLVAAQALHSRQASAALAATAQERGQQDKVAETLKRQTDALRGSGSSFPELSEAHLVLASPAGIETSTAQSTHIASGKHTALTTGCDLSIVAGGSMYASIKETFRLFVHGAGMKLIAAAGKITIEAKVDDIDVIAGKVLRLISQTDWIDLRGRKGIRLHGADSMLEISDVVQFFTAQPVLFHGNLETLGANNRPHPSQEALLTAVAEPGTKYDEQIQFMADADTALASVNYKLTLENGSVVEGTTDAEGKSQRIVTDMPLSIENVELYSNALHACSCLSECLDVPGGRSAPPRVQTLLQGIKTNAERVGQSMIKYPLPISVLVRPLTTNEIMAAWPIFQNGINYAKVKVHKGGLLFLPALTGSAMTPAGEIHFPDSGYRDDFTLAKEKFDQVWLIHELVHVWQYQLGYGCRANGGDNCGNRWVCRRFACVPL